MTQQWIRKWGLVVSTGSNGLDLSSLRMQFRTHQMDVDAPPTAYIRVYNLSSETAKQIQKEFQQVTLQAGYEQGNFGIIFQGTIKQVKRGRIDALDSYVDIFAADLDQAYNFGLISKTLQAGAKTVDQVREVISGMGNGAQAGSIPDTLGSGGTLPRGKVLFGLGREKLTDLTNSSSASWSIDNGKINVIPLTGYLPGEAVQINALTGMIGSPEATEAGIEVTTLLNPLIKLGTRVQLNNSDINQTTVKSQGFPQYSSLSFFANVTDDGFYRVLVAENRGDNRGEDWFTTLTCLAVDPSSSSGSSVASYG